MLSFFKGFFCGLVFAFFTEVNSFAAVNGLERLPQTELVQLGLSQSLPISEFAKLFSDNSYLLDLSDVDLTEDKFKKLFDHDGFFSSARNILLSFKSFKGNWIVYLPTEQLVLKPDGTARLRVKTTTGALFDYTGLNPFYPRQLGHGWRFPSGEILYEPLRTADGSPMKMNFWDSLANCSSYGLTVPTIGNYRTLGTLFGGVYHPISLNPFTQEYWDENDYIKTGGLILQESKYQSQVFKDFDGEVWSLSPDTYGSGRIFYFKTGRTDYLVDLGPPGFYSASTASSHLQVRCMYATPKPREGIDQTYENQFQKYLSKWFGNRLDLFPVPLRRFLFDEFYALIALNIYGAPLRKTPNYAPPQLQD